MYNKYRRACLAFLGKGRQFLARSLSSTQKQKRTTVTIAHRLSTIRHADKIAVIREGRVVEQGTHAELTLTGGVYAGLVDAQQS